MIMRLQIFALTVGLVLALPWPIVSSSAGQPTNKPNEFPSLRLSRPPPKYSAGSPSFVSTGSELYVVWSEVYDTDPIKDEAYLSILRYEPRAAKFDERWSAFWVKPTFMHTVTSMFAAVEAERVVGKDDADRLPLIMARKHHSNFTSQQIHYFAIDRLTPRKESKDYQAVPLTKPFAYEVITGPIPRKELRDKELDGLALLRRQTGAGSRILIVGSSRNEVFFSESVDEGKTWTKMQYVGPKDKANGRVLQVIEGKDKELLLLLQPEHHQGELRLVRGKAPQDWKEFEKVSKNIETNTQPALAVDKVGNIWMAYRGDAARRWGGKPDRPWKEPAILLTRSRDNARTWEPAVQVSKGQGWADSPALAIHDGKLFIAYDVEMGEGANQRSEVRLTVKLLQEPETKSNPAPREDPPAPASEGPAKQQISPAPAGAFPWGWLLLGGAAATLATAGILLARGVKRA